MRVARWGGFFLFADGDGRGNVGGAGGAGAGKRPGDDASGQRLIGGAQTGMGVQKIAALLDREGNAYFQEWAALFVWWAAQADRRASFIRGCRRRRAPAKVGRKSRRRYLTVCCTRNCGRCRRSIRTTGRRCCYRSYFPAPAAKVY